MTRNIAAAGFPTSFLGEKKYNISIEFGGRHKDLLGKSMKKKNQN